MSLVLERHGWETNSVIVSDTVIEEKTLDTDREAVERHLRSFWSDNVQRPIFVDELHLAICVCNCSIYGSWQSNIDSFLVRAFNKLNHGSFEKADETSSKLRPNIAMKMHLNILLRDHELNVDSADGGKSSTVKQLLCSKPYADLKLQALKLNISMSFCLNESFFKFKVTTMESSRQIVSFKNNCIVANIVVEID